MTADNIIGSNQLVSDAESKMPLDHSEGRDPEPKASGPVLIGGSEGKNVMSPAEIAEAEAEARKAVFRR